MSKDAFYFKHDSNARNDEKMLEVRRRFGMEGYGIYWAIIEKMRESSDYSISQDYASIAWDLRCKEATVKSVVEDYGLFIIEDGTIHSQRLSEDMEAWDRKRSAYVNGGRKGMQSRWGSRKENAENERQEAEPLRMVVEDEKTPPVERKPRQKKYNEEETKLHSACKDIFSEVYRQVKGVEFTWNAKEMAGVIGIIKSIRHQMKSQDDDITDNEKVADNFKAFITLTYQRADEWIKRNAVPSLISSKFNEIYTQIKNNTNNGSKQNATSGNARDNLDFLARIAQGLRTDATQ